MLIRIFVGFIAFYLFVEILYSQSTIQPGTKPVTEVKEALPPASIPCTKSECPKYAEPLRKTLESQKAEIELLKRENEFLRHRLEEIWEIINWYPKTTTPH